MDEEVEVINSIYEDCAELSPETYTVTLSVPDSGVKVKLWYPMQYPEEAPRVIGVSGLAAKFDAEKKLQTIVDSTFVPGEVYLYTFLDESEGEIRAMEEQGRAEQEQKDAAARTVADALHGLDLKGAARISEWSLTGEIRDRGSTFVGRAIRAHSEAEVEELLADLMYDKKVAKANHKMAAWRVPTSTAGVLAQDFDDDGEAGAGGCILHILQLAHVENVLVVVCRYFGGVHIGPDRFKHIKQSTRDALVAGGFIS